MRERILPALAACAALAGVAAGCGGGESNAGTTEARTQTAAPAAQTAPSLDPGESRQPKRRHRRRHRAAHERPADGPGRPPIVARPIDMDANRRAEMADYSQRHYGDASWRLDPQAIVEHYTATDSFASAYATFAQNTPDVELHELPGVCSHFIVDQDGTIYQLVKTTVRCRHTVGLNWAAIGIEHVGTSDGQVMGNPAQLAASLKLTRWLRCSYGIDVANVIGHNESLSSPLHHENVARLRSQTHEDMQAPAMDTYRSKLASQGC